MKVSIDSQAVNGESVNEVGERPTRQVSGCKRTTKQVPDDKSTFRTMVKRKKGLPKSRSKDIYYSKHCTHGCESTSLAKEILLFEKKHRRQVNIDDVVTLFHSLQVDEQPQAEYLVYHDERWMYNNYYSVLRSQELYLDDEPIFYDSGIYHKCSTVKRVSIVINDMTFDEIIQEHKFLMKLQGHNQELQTPQGLFEDPYAYDKQENPDKPSDTDKVSEKKDDPPGETGGIDPPTSSTVEDFSTIRKSFEPLFNMLRGRYDNADDYIGIMEDCIIIAYTLFYNEDPVILVAMLSLIYRRQYGGTLTERLMDYIEKFCSLGFEPDNMEKSQGLTIKEAFSNFKQLRNSVFLTKLTDALGLAITLGFVKPVKVSINKVELFVQGAKDFSKSSESMFSYILNLFQYFFETGYAIFNGDLNVLFHVSELSQIDEDIIHLQSYINSIGMGDYTEATGKTIEDYHALLTATTSTLRVLVNSTLDKTWKAALLAKLSTVTKLIVQFDQMKPLKGLRTAPFSFAVFGASSVGKSSFTPMIMNSVLTYNDFESSDSKFCTLQPTDKFYSTYKADVTAVLIDDICNTVFEKAVVNPAELLIALVNNVPYHAPKADVLEKGRILVRPKVVATTSNIRDFDAERWSNEPISVVRRLKYHLEIKVKPQYCTNNSLDYSKIDDEQVLNLKSNGIQDLWLVTICEVVRMTKMNRETYEFHVVTNEEGKAMRDVDIYDTIRFMNKRSAEHYKQQEEFVASCRDIGLRMTFCKKCASIKNNCVCVPIEDNMEKPSAGIFGPIDDACAWMSNLIIKSILNWYGCFVPNKLELALMKPVAKIAISRAFNASFNSIVNYMPLSIRNTTWFQNYYLFINRYSIIWKVLSFSIPAATIIASKSRNKWHMLSLIPLGIFSYNATRNKLIMEMKNMPLHILWPNMQKASAINNTVKGGLCLLTGYALIQTAIGCYQGLKKVFRANNFVLFAEEDELFSPEGNLNPTCVADICQRDTEATCWNKTSEPLPRCPASSTMTTDQLLNRITPNCLNAIIEYNNGQRVSIGCVALRSNIFCVPRHFFKKESLFCRGWRDSNIAQDKDDPLGYKVKFVKHDGISGNYFYAVVYVKDLIPIADLDLVLFRVASGGSYADITPFLLRGKEEGIAKTIRRDKEGAIHRGHCNYNGLPSKYGIQNQPETHFNIIGGRCVYNAPTAAGNCMTMIVRDTSSPSILGFHISGKSGTCNGSYTMFTQDELDAAIDNLNSHHGMFEPMAGSYMDLTRLSKNLSIDTNIPITSPASYIKDHNYVIRGNIGTQVSYYSEVKPTFMHDKVCKIFDIKNEWGPPKFGPKRYKPWYDYLAVSAEETVTLDSDILNAAMQDYCAPLQVQMCEYANQSNVRPLTLHEVINGIPGVRFVDHINFKSSIGFPLTGSKSNYLQGEPGNYSFIDEATFTSELENMESKYRNNERYYPIFKACLKDEPTKLDKDKVRVFQAADITLQLGWRKYGLPLLRFLSLYPFQSECAVGINPYNDEWDQLHNYVTDNGRRAHRIVAGDYSKWDQRLPPDLVQAAFNVLIELAKMAPGYSDNDIQMLKGLATDTMYYMCHFNGTLIEFNSGVPSGHNLTAHINSICNSIALRYGYIKNKCPMPFKKYCSPITYGDDFVSGVDDAVSGFNHITYSKVVSQMGMVLTMPDKTSTPTEFLNMLDTDFLKRKSILCSIDNRYYGALDIKSMIRSLLHKGKTSTNPREHATAVIKGFVFDLSFHTEETYNKYIGCIRQLLKETNIICAEAHNTYSGYYNYRNRRLLDYIDIEELDTPPSAAEFDDYQMTPKASNLTKYKDNQVSDYDFTLPNECIGELGIALANTTREESYSSTTVLGDSNSRNYCEVEETQAGVFSKDEGDMDTTPVETGTATISSTREHHLQDMLLQSQPLLSMRQDASRDLGQYLSRPLVVTKMSLLGNVERTTAVLYDFLASSRIRDKIRNYAYLNARLHIKAVVVGSPTIQGACIVALHPWSTRDNSIGPMGATINPRPDVWQLSQLPSFMVNYATETGGEISMPIICPSNGLNITETEQIKSAFAMHITSLVPAAIPPNSGLKPELTIYAWLTDVSLTGTSQKSELPQADEYTIPNEEKPSSDDITLMDSVKAAGKMVMGKATDIGIDMAMAAMGFSNPNSMDGVMPHTPRISNNMSCYNAPTNIDNLAGDYKNEVHVGSAELGFTDYDHMSINNIISRWGLSGSIRMKTNNGDVGFEGITVIPVHPLAIPWERQDYDNVWTPTPLAMGALPFNRWRGAITYKFVAIGSAFMKGKIKISHDVVMPRFLTGYDPNDLQTLNTVIWDISTHTSIEITVPWASNLAFKSTGLLKESVVKPDTNGEIPLDTVSNGALIISPLSVINDQEYSGVSILMYTKGEPGMAFGDMRAVLANYTFAGINAGQYLVPEPQAEEYIQDMDKIDWSNSGDGALRYLDGKVKRIDPVEWYNLYKLYEKLLNDQPTQTPQGLIYGDNPDNTILSGNVAGAIMKVNITGLDDNIDDHDKMAMLCMGEKWHSIRQIIKRYTQNWTRSYRPQSGNSYYRIRLPDRPILKGFQGSESLHISPTGKKCTYARDSFLSFYSIAYLGYRGSFRHKVMAVMSNNSTNSPSAQCTIAALRSPSGYIEERVAINAVSTDTTVLEVSKSSSSILTYPDYRAGGTVTNGSINPMIEYSTPFICSGKFAWAQDRTPARTKLTDDGGYDIPWHQICVFTSGVGTTPNVRVDKFVAAGDDFSLFFYLYAPRMTETSPGSYTQT